MHVVFPCLLGEWEDIFILCDFNSLLAMQPVSCTGWLLWSCVLNLFLAVCHAECELYWLIALIWCSESSSVHLWGRMWVWLVECADFLIWILFCFSAMQLVSYTDCFGLFWILLCLSVIQNVSCTGWLFWLSVLNAFLLVCHAVCELYWLMNCSGYVFWMPLCLSAMQRVSCTG